IVGNDGDRWQAAPIRRAPPLPTVASSHHEPDHRLSKPTSTVGHGGDMVNSGSDAAWFDAQPPRPAYGGMRYSSCYLTMRDGVRIAVNLYLPAGLASGA